MTTTPHGQVSEALRIADEFRECLEFDAIPSIIDIEKAEAELRRLHAYCQELEAQVIRDCMSAQQLQECGNTPTLTPTAHPVPRQRPWMVLRRG